VHEGNVRGAHARILLSFWRDPTDDPIMLISIFPTYTS
jgi:hypothetical protein